MPLDGLCTCNAEMPIDDHERWYAEQEGPVGSCLVTEAVKYVNQLEYHRSCAQDQAQESCSLLIGQDQSQLNFVMTD